MKNPAFKKTHPTRYTKSKIPKALREQVWISHMGDTFSSKCKISWCQNRMTAFDFQCGHNIPESKGGSTTLENLIPICARCNTSMGNTYTIDEWSKTFGTSSAPIAPVLTSTSSFCCCPWFTQKIAPS